MYQFDHKLLSPHNLAQPGSFEWNFVAFANEDPHQFEYIDQDVNSVDSDDATDNQGYESNNSSRSTHFNIEHIDKPLYTEHWRNNLPTYGKLRELTRKTEVERQSFQKTSRRSTGPVLSRSRKAIFQPSVSFGVSPDQVSEYATSMLFTSTMTAAERDLFGDLVSHDSSSPVSYLGSPAAHRTYASSVESDNSSYTEERPSKRRCSTALSSRSSWSIASSTPSSTSVKEYAAPHNSDELKYVKTAPNQPEKGNCSNYIRNRLTSKKPDAFRQPSKMETASIVSRPVIITGDLEFDLDIREGEQDFLLWK